jgi:hypothetical protein
MEHAQSMRSHNNVSTADRHINTEGVRRWGMYTS